MAADRPRMVLVPPPPGAGTAPAPRDHPRPARAGRARLRRGRVVLLVAADAVALAGALTAAVAAAGALGRPAPDLPAWGPAALAGAALAGWLALFAAFRLYDAQTRTIAPGGAAEAGALFHALLAGSLPSLLAAAGVEAAWGSVVWTPLEAVLFIAAALVAVPALRSAVRALLPSLVRPRRAVVVGAGPRGRRLERALDAHPEWGLEVAGFVDDHAVQVGPGPVLGRTAELTRIVEEHDIDWVLVSSSRSSRQAMLEAVGAARRPAVRLAVVPGAFEREVAAGTVEDLDGIPVVSLRPASAGARLSAAEPIPLHPVPTRSPWQDVRIFLRTAAAAGRRRGDS